MAADIHRMSIAQVRYNGVMRSWGWLFASVVFSVACTKPNPAKHCTDGTCTTPNCPFCDVTGAIGGEEGTCIAVTCTAGEFGECRGDSEVRCNANGNNYDVVQCERGCDPDAGGCRLCSPNETACTNGKVATCDANGTVMSMTECPLGCFQDEPRCREIDPSNNLAMYFDMVPNPPDLDLQFAHFHTGTGMVTDNGNPIDVPSFAVPAPANGVPMRVFVANSVNITRASADSIVNSFETTGPALVLLSRGDIRIMGTLAAHPSAGSGAVSPGCIGGRGVIRSNCNYSSSGGGGGGFATDGAKGGDVPNNSEPGGAGNMASGNETLVPLRGGCAGGGAADGTAALDYDGGGGGAIQLVSKTRIVVDGTIDVSGGGGGGDRYGQTNGFILNGGGAGGGILLEAPQIELGANAQLLANGGDGSSACTVSGITCSAAGKGAKAGVPPTAGIDIDCNAATGTTASGAGGGGLGRVRINTQSGTYTKALGAVESAVVTKGTVGTR